MIELNENFVIPSVQADGQDTFTNPLGNDGHPDPCIVYCEQEKCWYGISTGAEEFWGMDKLTLHRAEKFSDLFVNDESRVIYRSNPKVKPMKRLCHCQRVFFDETGFPHVGELIPCNTPYPVPKTAE